MHKERQELVCVIHDKSHQMCPLATLNSDILLVSSGNGGFGLSAVKWIACLCFLAPMPNHGKHEEKVKNQNLRSGFFDAASMKESTFIQKVATQHVVSQVNATRHRNLSTYTQDDCMPGFAGRSTYFIY